MSKMRRRLQVDWSDVVEPTPIQPLGASAEASVAGEAEPSPECSARVFAVGHAPRAHLVCTSCGAIVAFEDPRIRELELLTARRHGFQIDGSRLELYGRCLGCRSSDAAKPHPPGGPWGASWARARA